MNLISLLSFLHSLTLLYRTLNSAKTNIPSCPVSYAVSYLSHWQRLWPSSLPQLWPMGTRLPIAGNAHPLLDTGGTDQRLHSCSFFSGYSAVCPKRTVLTLKRKKKRIYSRAKFEWLWSGNTDLG